MLHRGNRVTTIIGNVNPKPKVEVAREHLAKAQDEAADGDPRDAVQWTFAALEAAIDALAEPRDIEINQKHWLRTRALELLHEQKVLPDDLSDLHDKLNEIRKGIFYDGDEVEADGFSVDVAIERVEVAVETAEHERGGGEAAT